MSGELSQLLNAVQSAIKAQLPELKTVELHGGRFTLDDIKSLATRTPGVFVTWLDLPGRSIHTKDVEADVQFMAFVLTRDASGLSRYESVLNITEHLTEWLPGKNFELPFAYPVTTATARNLHTAAIGKLGSTLSGIEWKQKIRLTRNSTTQPLLRYLYIDGDAPVEVQTQDESWEKLPEVADDGE